jgi:pilus assembly protein CpaB
MRKQRTLIVLLLAILSGGLAGYSALRLLQSRTAPVMAAEPARTAAQVVIAARDLPVGHLIGEEDVRVVDFPSSAVPEGYARSIPEVVGRGLITSVRLNEPLLDTKMADRSGQGGLSIVIPEGMRAVSLRVDEVVAVAGFVGTGTRVDLYLTTTPPGGGDQLTKIVMQNVPVLALAQNPERDPEGKPIIVSVITVLVTPEDGEKLIHATRAGGQIQLGLRNMLDMKDVRTTGARVANLLSGARTTGAAGPVRARTVAPTPQTPAGVSIEVYKAGVKSLIKF